MRTLSPDIIPLLLKHLVEEIGRIQTIHELVDFECWVRGKYAEELAEDLSFAVKLDAAFRAGHRRLG